MLFLHTPELRSQLDLSESTLVDDYVLGALPPPQRIAFEKNYLTSDERRSNVALARNIFLSARRERRRQMAWVAVPLAIGLALVSWAWRSIGTESALLELAQSTQRGLETTRFSLSKGGEILLLKPHLSPNPSGPIEVRVLRIGDSEPLLQLRLHAKSPGFVIPLPLNALQPGDYSLSVDAGPDFHQDFVFQIEP